MHQTVPESPRAMLQVLKNIDKVLAERFNEKARAKKAMAGTANKSTELRVPKKRRGKSSDRGTRKKGQSAKFVDGPFTTHDILMSVVGSRRIVVKRTSLLSPPSPERNPGRKGVPETPIR